MQTIALFGATGKTGRILVKKLTAKGYPIRALVRNPAKLENQNNLLTAIQGDVLNEQAVFKVLEKSDVVINVIGHVKGCPPDLQTVASRNILNGMKKLGITRLIDLTGGAVKVEGDDPKGPDKLIAFVMKNLAGKAVKARFTDGENHVKLISRSNLDWTIVRAPVLLPGKAKGRTSIGMVGHIGGYSLTYEDLTDQIINILDDRSFVRQYPYITNG
jgi:putative NADH-flavin reductase